MNLKYDQQAYGHRVGVGHFEQSSAKAANHLAENYPSKEVRTVPVVPGRRPELATQGYI